MRRGKRRVLPKHLEEEFVHKWNCGVSSTDLSCWLREDHKCYVEPDSIKQTIRSLRKDGWECEHRKRGWNIRKDAGVNYTHNRAQLNAALALRGNLSGTSLARINRQRTRD